MTAIQIITPADAERAFAELWREAESADPAEARGIFFRRLGEIAPQIGKQYAVDKAQQIAEALGLAGESFQDDLAAVFREPEPINGRAVPETEAPFPDMPPEPPSEPLKPAKLVTPADWPEGDPPAIEWLWRGMIPRGEAVSLHADGGVGKTELAVMLSAACSRGALDCLGETVEPGPVLFISAEEPQDQIRRRLARIGNRQGFRPAECAALHLWFPDDLADCTLAAAGGSSRKVEPTAAFHSLAIAARSLQPVLIVVDSVAATFVGNQIDRVNARSWVSLWRRLAQDTGAAVLLLDHPSLSGINEGTGRSGNMDWRNAVRLALHMTVAKEPDEAASGVIRLEMTKCNLGPKHDPINLLWVDGLLTVEGSGSPLERAARDDGAERKFIELLAERNTQGRYVGASRGRNFAPYILAAMPNAEGYNKKALQGAMERLFQADKIVLEAHGAPSRGLSRLVARDAT